MHTLVEMMAKRISSGLKRKSMTTCSRWACAYRYIQDPFTDVMGKWSFKYFPWLIGMHDSTAERNVGQKSAQMGYTEAALNIAFFSVDVRAADVLYVLPAKNPDASDFSSGRFDPAIESSPYLSMIFSDVKNVGHKRAGSNSIYVRGSRSRSGLKGLPVGTIILDELDEFTKENIPLALQRTIGQVFHMEWMFSTPTVPGEGVNAYFENSTKEKFHFRCPGCKRFIDLIYPECLELAGERVGDPRIVDSKIICRECKKVLADKENWRNKWEVLQNGIWIPSYKDKTIRGFHVSQLYSCVKPPSDLAEAVFESENNPAAEQELYNSRLGDAHVVSGAQLTDEDIFNRIRGHRNGQTRPTHLLTMGVDVGAWLHYEIDQWKLGETIGNDLNTDAFCQVIEIGKVREFSELDKLMMEYGIHCCVVDANPETRMALQFANRFYGFVRLCIYGKNIRAKDIIVSADEEHKITVDRTSWLDMSLGRFKVDGKIILPHDTPLEYKDHMKAPIRRYKYDKDGNPVGVYENGSRPDHFAHARNYAEIALPIAATIGKNKNIRSPV